MREQRIVIGACLSFLFLLLPTASAEVYTIQAFGIYTTSDYEDPQTGEKRALDYAIQSAAEQAGVYVKSYTKTRHMQVVEDEIDAVASKNVNILSRIFSRDLDSEGNIRIRADVTATIDTQSVDYEFVSESDATEVKSAKTKELRLTVEKYNALKQATLEQDKNINDLKKKLSDASSNISDNERKYLQEKANREFLSLAKTKEAEKAKEDVKISLLNEAIKLNPKNNVAYLMLASTLADPFSKTKGRNWKKQVEINVHIAELLSPIRETYVSGGNSYLSLVESGFDNKPHALTAPS